MKVQILVSYFGYCFVLFLCIVRFFLMKAQILVKVILVVVLFCFCV